ncbi:hypothetical protein CASFOL_016275 [Castilleja foliolosa]|uniref:3'-5' exonuclease domain-containing protein n=1 Tax=Castilleja foliolosa TaxID=1961234 RepID=A0ABD3DGX8_9LAMI
MEEKGGKILMNNMRIEKYFSFTTHTLYQVFVNKGDEIQTLVTHNARVVELWINKNIRVVNSLIVGLGVQWRPNFIRGEHRHPVATLQLSLGKYCLIFQILESGCCIPDRLREFLGDPRYTFVGVGVGYNVMMLSTDCGLRVANIRELNLWAAFKLDRMGLDKAGLKLLVKEILGVEMEKPKNIKFSLWDSPELSLDQVAYASRDAYFSFEIGRSLSARY